MFLPAKIKINNSRHGNLVGNACSSTIEEYSHTRFQWWWIWQYLLRKGHHLHTVHGGLALVSSFVPWPEAPVTHRMVPFGAAYLPLFTSGKTPGTVQCYLSSPPNIRRNKIGTWLRLHKFLIRSKPVSTHMLSLIFANSLLSDRLETPFVEGGFRLRVLRLAQTQADPRGHRHRLPKTSSRTP